MKKIKKAALGILLLCPLIFASCSIAIDASCLYPIDFGRNCRTDYTDYNCDWISTEPVITLFKGCGSGQMIIDGTTYNFHTALANDASDIEFYMDNQKVLWCADTELKDGTLYLTVTVDNISNYAGKTIALSQSSEKRYWTYNCDWVSTEPEITLHHGGYSGKMVINGTTYEFRTLRSYDASHIDFTVNDNVLWSADTVLQDGYLYLTVTVDNVSDYAGKTIKLSKAE